MARRASIHREQATGCPDPAALGRALMAWYAAHGRHDLPWRRSPAPWAVLVSEMMLQQTQVPRVVPYFERWMERFPNPQALADTEEAEVLEAWWGLGYYRRARALHSLAKAAADRGIPDTLEGLLALPGVGPYTAAAVMAFAHNQPIPPLDTNLKRLLTRLTGGADETTLAAARSLGTALMEQPGQPRDTAAALMDLGALVCAARRPRCTGCPLSSMCPSAGRVEEPVATRSAPRPRPVYAIGALRDGRTVLLPMDGGLLVARILPGEGAREALQRVALADHGVHIAVRPAMTHDCWRGKAASLHRCTPLYGAVEGFAPADGVRVGKLSRLQRQFLAKLRLSGGTG